MSYNPLWLTVLQAPFVQRAFIAGILISVAAGLVGYFVITRKSAFAAHALAHIGLPGATGAVLLGIPVLWGMGLFSIGGALVIGALGKRAADREVATGSVLAFATALGLYFSNLSSGAAKQMQSILFGSVLTITDEQLFTFAAFDIILLAVLLLIFRPLLFSSLDENVARAKGLPVTLLGIIFMIMMGSVITVAVPAVGTLLIFALVITPADTAMMITRSPLRAIVMTIVLCLIAMWGGLVLSTIFDMPPSFVIVSLSVVIWLVVKGLVALKR
ncbi:zinc ABC transporter permease [Alloscardovia macacae]|uniref:Zinc ABC transporter permease n=1 Tax=Alloscardovia macacae TaxID=1160091 RepID=A0A1Y2T1H6_9BIFI|nr:metal ABC transporter permease [Alloscardovia macacae]OTA27066.1 zinc ABC transporter permease [Alloscardovia macacae]OTA29741.1 zinc ABC transporter permease [Alloscardovia macacae]